MGGKGLGCGGDVDKLGLAYARGADELGHGEGAVGQGAGLVEHDGLGGAQGLQVVRPLHQNAEARCPADAAEERQRYGDDQCAGARHHEEGESAQDPVGPLTAEQQRGHDGEYSGHAHDDGGVHAGEAGDEVLGACLLLGGVFHQFQDAAYRGVLEGLGGAYDEFGRQVHAAGDDLVAWARRAGHRLAGERRRVNLAFAGQHRAVERDALTGHDDELVVGGQLEGIDLLELPLFHDVGELRCDVHHIRDGLARLVHGVALEQLAHLEEQHNGGALGHMRLGVGEQHQGERAESGHGHEEVLVQRVPVRKASQRAGDDVVAGDKIGDEKERELGVHIAGGAEDGAQDAGLGRHFDGDEQHEGDDDAGEESFLLRVHGES